MKTCLYCQKEINQKQKYCNQKCHGQHTEQKSIENWLAGKIPGHRGKVKNIKPFVRNHLFRINKSSCSKCGWNVPHPISGIPPLEVNHIDGNADNTILLNLELLCPNCHALTITYKNRNKGNGNRSR